MPERSHTLGPNPSKVACQVHTILPLRKLRLRETRYKVTQLELGRGDSNASRSGAHTCALFPTLCHLPLSCFEATQEHMQTLMANKRLNRQPWERIKRMPV